MHNSYLGYYGPEWDKKIQDKDNPNFWKYGVANLVFLDLIKKSKKILDVGCGTGGLTVFLAEHAQLDYIIGIDPVKSMIQVAKQRALQKGLDHKTDFVICDGRCLPFRQTYFHALVSRGDAFVFLVPQKIALIEFKRVLKNEAILVIEQDNVQWKPGKAVFRGFERMADGGIAYSVENFDNMRNHTKMFYILDQHGTIANKILEDKEFIQTGRLRRKLSIRRIETETIETKQSAVTHWSTVDEMRMLLAEEGFKTIEIFGDGLLMRVLLDGDQKVTRAMKKQPELFFEIEKKLIRFIDPASAPTVILKGVTP
jgi:ubiquinone/menaquinone biosynthesis C-methylase UbiE